MDSRRSNNEVLLWLVCGICTVLLLPALFMDGMFIDGQLYAAVSMNYASGNGTFWYQHFSETHYKAFHEQPPLMFFLEGSLMKLLGDSIYVERLYCALMAVANAWALHTAWKAVGGSSGRFWLPLLLWFIMPVTFWAFTNNVEECTMGLWVLISFVYWIKADSETSRKRWRWLLMAGIFTLLAGLTKGVQGMFLLSAPFWSWVILRRKTLGSFIADTAAFISPSLLFAGVAWLTPSIRNSFAAYFQSRFGKTFSNVTATTGNRFHLLYELFLDTLPVVAIAVVLWLIFRKKAEFAKGNPSRLRVVLLLALGFSGVLPLMVTLEQRGFYLVTALPFFALAGAIIADPYAGELESVIGRSKWTKRILWGLSAILLTGSLTATFILAGQPKRDADKIKAIQEIAAATGKGAIIMTTTEIDSDWSFLTYAQRNYRLHFHDRQPGYSDTWFLCRSGCEVLPEGYMAVPMSVSGYVLARKVR